MATPLPARLPRTATVSAGVVKEDRAGSLESIYFCSLDRFLAWGEFIG